ncbi:hypothetical protein C7271_00035 [filamentous cyanobacterium CCP5]|nr:hypothetical protein C7271_00035 [filamentous cyanobacterium CCP5]
MLITHSEVFMATVFINEFHYDNAGTDTGEFIEIAGPVGTNLSGWSLVLYNGNGGGAYDTVALSGVVADQADGFGTVVVDFPPNGLQNGSPDGIALVDTSGNVVEFISYEGSFTAIDGPAVGLTSTDIGVAETSSTPIGQSLQLIDGVWTGPALATKGAVNGSGGGGGNEPTFKFIHEIQGSGAESPFVGSLVLIEGIVVGDFQGGSGLNGFFVQEEDADADGDLITSEGIFVFDGSFGVDVNVGDRVQVTGVVDEFFNLTQLNQVSSVAVLDVAQALPSAATVNFPVASLEALEAVEGMRVAIPDTLFVTEYFNLDRFGEIRLASDGSSNAPGTDERLDQYTQFNAPDAAGFAAYQAELAPRQIVLDDGSNVQNPDTLIFGRGGQPLSATNPLRGGDSIQGLTGVLSYSFGDYRIQTNTGVDFQPTNPRPAAPEDVGGSLQVASFNVLNYFTTIDDGNTLTDAGLEPRGADNLTRFGVEPAEAEFNRQTEKLVTALLAIDADVFGLVELENSADDSALVKLVAELNAVAGAGTFDYIPTGLVGTDAITVGMIYKPGAVTPIGEVAILDDSSFTDPNNTGLQRNRPAIAHSFIENATGEIFTAAVNHFKSKGASGLSSGPSSNPDADQLDGQGFWNDTRTKAAIALASWLASDPTGSGDPDALILGDLNAYAQEDPITALEAAGYTDLAELFVGAGAYSFVFDGQLGTLDYALANSSLLGQVTGTTEWHVNADEPDALDYNLDFGRDPSLFDGDLPYRNSDHDPLIVGLDLAGEFNLIDAGNGKDSVTGTEGSDRILGGNGKDIIFGGEGNDLLEGGNGNDSLYGEGGFDFLIGGRGNDLLDGGEGIDFAIYEGVVEDFSFSGTADNLKATAPGIGTDTLLNIEFIRFLGNQAVIATAELV